MAQQRPPDMGSQDDFSLILVAEKEDTLNMQLDCAGIDDCTTLWQDLRATELDPVRSGLCPPAASGSILILGT